MIHKRKKIDKLDLIKMKNFSLRCQENGKKSETGRKYLQNIYLIKDLSRIHKDILKLTNKKTSNPIFKNEQKILRYFTKEIIQMANKHMKKASYDIH